MTPPDDRSCMLPPPPERVSDVEVQAEGDERVTWEPTGEGEADGQ